MSTADDPRRRYEDERERLEAAGTNTDPVSEVLDALDPEVRAQTFQKDGNTVTVASNTLGAYTTRLRMITSEVDRPLLELGNSDIDALLDDLASGDASPGPSDGYAESTLGQFASALIAFYRYHDGHSVEPDEIVVASKSTSSVDERDLWDLEEVSALREVIDSKRDEALFELLAYTGQRIRVIQTLRVKDVDPDKGSTGRYYVNESVEGRKNREGHGPLLGAQGAVRRWLQVHPTGDPEDALITSQPDHSNQTTPGDRISQTAIRKALQRIADAAGVEKDVHPHMFRHYFTTVTLKPEERGGFGMDPTYVKRLRGDAPGSDVMETTYAHLIDEDASAHAEAQFTGEEPEGNALTPAAPCSVCGEMLKAGDKACSNCGAKRAPDAEKSEVEQLQDRIEELESEREVQQEVGAAKAMDPDNLTEEEIEAIANDDTLIRELIEVRSAG